MQVTATIAKLATYASHDCKLYATPTTPEKKEISQVYWATQPQWRHDFAVADPDDFAELAGYSAGTFADPSAFDLDEQGDEEITIEVRASGLPRLPA